MIVPVSSSNSSVSALISLRIAPPQPLGRKLDRSQRVLDLVRDPARNIGPRGLALIQQLARDIFKADTVPVLALVALTASVSRSLPRAY
jgi:hypothetical protein